MATAPESVAIRQRGSYDFETHYCSLCALQDTVPLLEVKAHLCQGVLDINADKIRLVDWPPILNTLRINKNLRFIAVRSYYAQSDKEDGKRPHYFKRRPPAIQSKDMTLRLAQSISECLKNTESLKCIDLQGVPFRQKDLASLAKGLERNVTLTHVSLEYCQIRDEGCNRISESLKHHPYLTHLNFTGCCLTCKSADTVAKLIKHQSTERHSEAWVDSLRYRQPNLNSMTGLRRITLNHNSYIGDEGAAIIADALKDDLWLKALDLQKCGIGRDGANALLDMLTQNKTLLVLDVRFNPLIDRSVLHSVIAQVLINSNGYDDKEFPWIKSDPPKDPYRTRPRRRCRQISSAYGRKSVRAVPKIRTGHVSSGQVNPGGEGFVPWRTAYRASLYKRTYADGDNVGTPRYLQNAEARQTTIHIEEETMSESETEEEEALEATLAKSKPTRSLLLSPKQSEKSHLDTVRDLKIELLQARKTVAEERKARQMAEQHAMNLEIENVRLKRELANTSENNGIRSTLDDENLLESIENSFSKFHDFLDLLKQLGLGGLVAYAGMSNLNFPLGDNAKGKGDVDDHPGQEMKKHAEAKPPNMNERGRKMGSAHSGSRSRSQGLTDSDEDDVVSVPPPITIHSQSAAGDAKTHHGKSKTATKKPIAQQAGDAK